MVLKDPKREKVGYKFKTHPSSFDTYLEVTVTQVNTPLGKEKHKVWKTPNNS